MITNLWMDLRFKLHLVEAGLLVRRVVVAKDGAVAAPAGGRGALHAGPQHQLVEPALTQPQGYELMFNDRKIFVDPSTHTTD